MRPRASLLDVLRGRAPLLGPRIGPGTTALVSPIEARLAFGLAYGDPEESETSALEARSPLGDLAVLFRAAIAAWVPRPEGVVERRPFIVSTAVDPLTVEATLDAIFAQPPSERARLAYFVHPHALNLAARSVDLRARLARADLILPDGFGIRLAASILGLQLGDNVNGTDLFPLLCARAASEGRPLIFVGGAPSVAERAAETMRDRTPGLVISHVSHGFLDAAAIAALRETIAKSERPIVLVGMGTPNQERFADEHLADIPGATVLTVGGLFDFFSGRIPRAPQFLRELGLEWAFRLAQEPRRMARRYLLGNPEFVARALLQRFRATAADPDAQA